MGNYFQLPVGRNFYCICNNGVTECSFRKTDSKLFSNRSHTIWRPFYGHLSILDFENTHHFSSIPNSPYPCRHSLFSISLFLGIWKKDIVVNSRISRKVRDLRVFTRLVFKRVWKDDFSVLGFDFECCKHLTCSSWDFDNQLGFKQVLKNLNYL